jgi:hypothetical protein
MKIRFAQNLMEQDRALLSSIRILRTSSPQLLKSPLLSRRHTQNKNGILIRSGIKIK